MLSISPSKIARYFYHECERNLIFNAVPKSERHLLEHCLLLRVTDALAAIETAYARLNNDEYAEGVRFMIGLEKYAEGRGDKKVYDMDGVKLSIYRA